MRPRACSARAGGTRTETRRRSVSGSALFSFSKKPSSRAVRLLVGSLRRTPRAASRCSSVSRRGTMTLTSTRWSPRPKPCSTGIPFAAEDADLARLRAGLELELHLAVERRDGHASRRAPPASIVRSTVREDVVAVAHEALVGRDAHLARRRRRPDRRATPAWPSPRSRIRWPSWIPAGPRPRASAARATRPAPSHSPHGCSTTLPAPPQRAARSVRTNSPKTLRETCCTRPAPPQVGQVARLRARLGAVAVAALARRPRPRTSTSRVAPVAASTSSISTSAATSAPRARPPAAPPPKRSSPKNAEKMSARLPRSKWVGVKPPLRSPAWP